MGKEEENEFYDGFIRNGLACGFTDDQINFLWDMYEDLKQTAGKRAA